MKIPVLLVACFLIKHLFLTKIYSNKFPKISAIDIFTIVILPFVSMMYYFVYVILPNLAYLYGIRPRENLKLLPDCNENILPKADTFIHTIGFGSDNFLNDYKVIYNRVYVDLETDIPGPTHYAVYKMSIDSWRVLKGEDLDLVEDLYLHNNINNKSKWCLLLGGVHDYSPL